jgi:hypothetical protein
VAFKSTSKTISIGENAVFEMSALNPVGGKEMQVQLTVKPPSGISIYSTNFARSGGGLSEAKYTLPAGSGAKGLSLEIIGNEQGTYQIDADIYYAFPDGESHSQKQTLTLEVQSPDSKGTGYSASAVFIPSSPGFGAWATVLSLFSGMALLIAKRN